MLNQTEEKRMRVRPVRWLGGSLFWITTALYAQVVGEASTDPTLQQELLQLRQVDQAALRDKNIDSTELKRLQRENTSRLKEIVRLHGWPTLSMVGNEAAQGAWLVVQHADEDRAWQREALGLMEVLVPSGQVRKSDVAYLRDRLDMSDSGHQFYGTQGHCVAKGVWAPFEVIDSIHLDERRKAMDMTTEEAYLKKASFMCANFKNE